MLDSDVFKFSYLICYILETTLYIVLKLVQFALNE